MSNKICNKELKEIENKAKKGILEDEEILIYYLYWLPLGTYLYDKHKHKYKKKIEK